MFLPPKPASPSLGCVPVLHVVLALLLALLLAVLAFDVTHQGLAAAWDGAVSAWFARHRSPGVTRAMVALSAAHATLPITCAMAAIALWLALHRAWRRLAGVLLVLPGGMVLNVAVKLIVHRARPDVAGALAHSSFYSFPSGHTAASAMFYTLLCTLAIDQGLPRAWRPLLPVLAGFMVLAVAASRIYLGVHFFSDTLAGLIEAAAWLSLCLPAVRHHRPSDPP